MLIIGCDYHPSFQQIAFVDTETGELREERLDHREGAEKFYRGLAVAGQRWMPRRTWPRKEHTAALLVNMTI